MSRKKGDFHMKYEELTNEVIDQKILNFRNKNPKLIGHNLYYAVIVNEDGTVADERYGANLMTNRGFRQQYYSYSSGPDGGSDTCSTNIGGPDEAGSWFSWLWLLIGTGYTSDTNGTTYTGSPKLTDQCMEEYAGEASTWTSNYADSVSIIETGYDNKGTMDNGFVYLHAKVGQAMFNYQQALPATSVTGHTGGTPETSPRDTRWQQDTPDGPWYFNITEIGGVCCKWSYNSGSYPRSIDDPCFYYKPTVSSGSITAYCNSLYPDENKNTKDFSKRNVVYHFLLVDENNNPSPLKKQHNQKLYIWVYITLVFPEKMITDLWKDKKYLVMNPQGYNQGNYADPVYISIVSGNWMSRAWWNQNPITNLRSTSGGNDNSYIFYIKNQRNWKLSEEDGGYPWDENPYGTDDGVSITYSYTTPSRLIEDKWCFISHFTLSNVSNSTGYISDKSDSWRPRYCVKDCSLVTFDTLDEPDEITSEIYCNSTLSSNISDQFGLVMDSSNKNGLLPITHVENPASVTHAYLFNYDTGESDIPVDISIPEYYYGGWRTFFNCARLKNFICPDSIKRDILCYFNPFAYKENDTDYSGAYPGMIISSFDSIGIQLFAADKYWDCSTWVQFINTSDTSSQTDPSNGQLLVQKKYFIMYDTGETSKYIMNITFKDECLPKMIPHTDLTVLTKYDETTDTDVPLTITNHDITEMIGNDEYKYFTVGDYIIKMKGESGKGVSNTLQYDEKYYIQHAMRFKSLYHSRLANGKNVVYRLKYDYNSQNSSYIEPVSFITFIDITQESIIPSADTTCKSLKNHFFSAKYPTTNVYEDHNGRFMILSSDAISSSTQMFDSEGNTISNYPACITIFDTSIDVETSYPIIETNIKSLFTRAYISTSTWNIPSRYNYNQWIMNSDSYLEIEPNDCVMFFNQYFMNDDHYTGNMWCGIVYDENKNILHYISERYSPFTITHPNAKYLRIAMLIYNNNMPSDVQDIWYTNNKNYGCYAPCIKNAKHGIVIKGSSNKMAYNDISRGVELQYWNIIDLTNPVDGNGDPIVIDSFEIDPNFIGGTYNGGIGFSHYVYIKMNDKNNVYSFWLYDINTQELKHLVSSSWNGFDDSTTSRHGCFVANDDIMCYCGAINNNSITNSNTNYGSVIYCITADDPENIHEVYTYNDTFTSLQLKTVNWGTASSPKNQLLLSAYGYGSYSSSTYNYKPKIVLDIGKWLQTKSWTNGSPDGFFNVGGSSTVDAKRYEYIYDRGVIELQNGKSSDQTSSLVYRPLEYLLPMEITVQTKTINAFNNPIQISGKTYTFTRTNNLEHHGYGITT